MKLQLIRPLEARFLGGRMMIRSRSPEKQVHAFIPVERIRDEGVEISVRLIILPFTDMMLS
ncbi:hypothetical protein IscW_ISCW017032 [Ixodes scapularis]|uniref:Uncharacterized protein n=1 Tax=Ixodes scapularis TaxID=6945 RepID=B7PCG0_IXOSC|nr:hypothetical protein IscW_ISCW017032 [Ixodes scapularis]|eukprot:XP_002409803.1 hypothetical protein IscW_ISCW017032 [Ixodes scapularis]